MKSSSGEALSSSSESEILFFKMGASSGSSRMSSDPSQDKSVSGPRIVELGMEEGVTTREAPPFVTWEITAKGVTGGNNKRQNRESGLGLNSDKRNGSLWRSGCLGGQRCSLTNPFDMSTLFSGYWLGGRGGSFGRSHLCSSRGSGCCKYHIGPIEKAFHGYTHEGKNLLISRAIYG